MEPWTYRTIIEPFRIKAVEPIPFLTPEERRRALRDAGYNLFKCGPTRSRSIS